MKYIVLFGGAGCVKFPDFLAFQECVANNAEGIQALQRSDATETITYRIGDETLPEDVRNDWNKIAEYIQKKDE